MNPFKFSILSLVVVFAPLTKAIGQHNLISDLFFLHGDWVGVFQTDSGKSFKMETSFNLLMDSNLIEIKSNKNYEIVNLDEQEKYNEIGYISYENNVKSLVYRQFNSGGNFETFSLKNLLSNDSTFVFEIDTMFPRKIDGIDMFIIRKNGFDKISIEKVFQNKNGDSIHDINILTFKTSSKSNLEPKATGIGGIFFFSASPSNLRNWYKTNLGLEVNEWGSTFEFRNANDPDEINYLQWSPFKNGSKYFEPSKKEFMINYRVQNIEALVIKLKANGATVVDEIESFDYGKFVHVLDSEGNKLELWEPIDSELTKLGGKTTK